MIFLNGTKKGGYICLMSFARRRKNGVSMTMMIQIVRYATRLNSSLMNLMSMKSMVITKGRRVVMKEDGGKVRTNKKGTRRRTIIEKRLMRIHFGYRRLSMI
jgi:hypothetical protein